jgi:hypothetical protein
MIDTITRAAAEGQLTTVTCRDKATNEEVEILCIKIDGGLKPIGRIYPDADYAMADVSSPGGHSEQRTLH